MIPKFRAWLKKEKCFADQVDAIRPQLCEIDLSWKGALGSECFNLLEDVELMQSTGLFDENDKEIFDGDILKVKIMNGQSWLEIVRYNDEKAMFVSKEMKRKVPESPLYDLFNTDLFVVEVVGNIYENPELLEVTE